MKMKMNRKLTSLGSFSLVLAVSAIALADGPSPPSSNTPSTPRPIVPPPAFTALPTGTTTTPPKDKAPTRIPKTEKVDGFSVGDPPKNPNNTAKDAKITNVIVFGKEEDAKAYTAGKGFGSSANDDTMCFAQPPRLQRSPMGMGANDVPAEWSSDIEPTARISAPMKPPAPRKKDDKQKKDEKPKPFTVQYGDMEVTAMHQERFIQDDKKAHLEIIDAWVDPVTHGVRLIGKATLPLERIGSAWHGVKLYAARGDKDKVLHVVARRDKLMKDPASADQPSASKSSNFRMLNATRQPLMIEMPSGEHDQTQCGFAHVMLKAQPGTAETAMFETNTVFIDPVAKAEEKEKTEKTEDDNMMGFGSFNGGRGEDGPVIRVRPFRATVSSTWSSKDTAPVISVSFGWAGREREM